jgi:hypothetical protein
VVPCPGVYRFLFAELFSWMYIFCLPSPEAFSWSLLLLAFILKPMKFFLAAVAFMAAFVLNGNLLEWEVKGLYRLFMKNINIWGCFFFLHFASFVVMAWFFFWETAILCFFSILYGIISIDFQKLREMQ